MQKSHTNQAIDFFSYIWFKYDILSLHCYNLRSVVVILLGFQPPHLGSTRAWVVNVWNGKIRSIDVVRRNGEEMCRAFFFFLVQNLALQLGVGAAMSA